MRFEAVGVDGSKQQGSNLCSMLIGDSVLLDAGSASMLAPEQQLSTELVLLTHSHLDHILELGFMVDATVSTRGEPLRVMGSMACLDSVQKHYMNDLIWPDFSRIRTGSGPALVYSSPGDREWFDLPGGLKAWMEPVCHGAGGRGFLFRSDTGSILYTGDTGPTNTIWERASEMEDLRFVVAEVSFPDRLRDVAIASDHLTPGLLQDELRKLGDESIPVHVFHLKPWLREEITEDIQRRFDNTVSLLLRGDSLEF